MESDQTRPGGRRTMIRRNKEPVFICLKTARFFETVYWAWNGFYSQSLFETFIVLCVCVFLGRVNDKFMAKPTEGDQR